MNNSYSTTPHNDIQAEFTREFKNIARKYGINYGIIKNNPNPHHVVFQAKDKKLLDSCLKDYRSKVKAKTAKRAASKARNQGIRKNIADKCRVIETNLDNTLKDLKEKIKQAAIDAKEESEKKKEKKAEIKTEKKAEKSAANKTKKPERVEKAEKVKEKGREKTKSRKRERGVESR